MPTSSNLTQSAALPDYLTQEQLSAKLHVDLTTIWRMRRRGVLPYVKFGRSVLFDPAAVVAVLEKLTVGGSIS